ncbi:hypothetical protein ABLN87_15180 [Ruegeria sp. SCPT10]|uniref:hypothetical protein n=1 Tax=Ruegeria sp. SCP10 TaxID=3141377 RepID=UPI0033386736
MKKLLLSFVGVGALTASVALADDTVQKNYLFVESADKVELVDGKLVLHGVDDQVSVFADRPYRDAGVISMAHFLDVWTFGDDSFEADPPNAALSGEIDGKSHVVIVEISAPKVNGDKLEYAYKVIEGEDIGTMDNAVMFIDGWWSESYTGPFGGLPGTGG